MRCKYILLIIYEAFQLRCTSALFLSFLKRYETCDLTCSIVSVGLLTFDFPPEINSQSINQSNRQCSAKSQQKSSKGTIHI